MTEDALKHFAWPNFTYPLSGTLRAFLDNSNTTRDKFYLKGLGVTKGESGGVAMMLKIEMKEAQYYNIFN